MLNPENKNKKDTYVQYLAEHQNQINQALHFFGVGLLFFLIIFALFIGPLWLILLGIAIRFCLGILGHFVFEKNGFATRTNPFLHFWYYDVLLFWDILTFKLPGKMKELENLN